MDVLAECPKLLVQDKERTHYEGYVTVANQDFRVSIKLRERGRLKGAQISTEWRLKHLLLNQLPILQQRLQQSTSLAGFLLELKSVIERQLDKESAAPLPPNFYTYLLEEIEEVGWHRLSFISESFEKVHLVAEDKKKRQHVLKVFLHSQHPDVSPEFQVDFPHPFHIAWQPKMRLSGVLLEFEKSLAQYMDLWDCLDELDANTWIIEPEKPTKAALHRRIALGEGAASVSITLDPRHPHQLPECRFMGADHVVNPLRENMNKNLEKWDPHEPSVLKNLQGLLAIRFPSPSNTKKEDVSVACSICYAYRLSGELPSVACDDPRCQQPFHQTCLYEWLRGLASSRQSFNMLFGECPYCGKPITVKMPTG